MRVRWHKFKAKSSKCLQGHYHPSKLEAGHCNALAEMQRRGEVKEYEYGKRYDLKVNGKKVCSHIPDFTVYRSDGFVEVHECKGMELPVWNLKRKLFEIIFPDIEYIVIK